MEIKESIKNTVGQFLAETGINIDKYKIFPIAGDGSERSFSRIILYQTAQSYVVMENFPYNEACKKENYSYFMIGKHLFNKGFPLPEIFAYNVPDGIFIMQDLGDTNLQDEAASSCDRIHLYKDILKTLLRMQIDGAPGFKGDYCCQTAVYDVSVMREKEAYYFRDSFLVNYLGMDLDLTCLEKSFEYIIKSALQAKNHFFMHRDFQSRNIMITKEGSGIIDWQGARLGPLAYDLASLLIDPYVSLSSDERKDLFDYYFSMLKSIDNKLADNFKKSYPFIALLRNMQILGAYSYLSKKQGKSYFEKYIPPAVRSLYYLLHEVSDAKLLTLNDITDTINNRFCT